MSINETTTPSILSSTVRYGPSRTRNPISIGLHFALPTEKEDAADRPLLGPPGQLTPPNETQISLICLECGGALYEQKEGEIAHFICHISHSFSPKPLTEAHEEVLERALWIAVRTLNERVTLHRQFLRRQRNVGEESIFRRFEESVAAAERDVELLREIIARL